MSEKKPKEIDQNSDDNGSEGSQKKDPETRQDLFVCFTNEKDLRHYESIRIKSSLYTGIAIRVKNLVPTAMDNLLYAIELDQQGNSMKQAGDVQDSRRESRAEQAQQQQPMEGGLVNLRFEECRITRKAANSLAEFLKKKQILETLGFVKTTFEDIFDFKKILEGVQQNTKLSKILFSNMVFDEELFGKSIARALIDSRSIREIDLSYLSFDHPKCFYDISTAILNERCRLNILKIRGTQITNLEGKIIQYILMKNKQLHTLDLSFCRTDDPENFICFFQKLDQFCNIRYLTFDSMQPDLSSSIEVMGEALSSNNKLEVLIMRENKIKWVNYCNFWSLMLTNTALQKLNLQKTDLSDRVLEKMVKYLEQPDISLVDLDISKNGISDTGLKCLCVSLRINKTLKFLNLSGNKIKEEGLIDLVDFLSENKTLQELSIGSNIISNEGIIILSKFLQTNSTLQHLEIPKNAFTDVGFEHFAKMLGFNNGLKFLDIAKNKDLSDEASLIVLAEALEKNRCLKTLDLSSLKIRKPFLKQHLEPALKKNITLQKIIGKIPPNIIEHELQTNIIIEKEIMPLYQPIAKITKGMFNLKLVESEQNQSRLDLKDQQNRLVKPSFKFIKYFDIRSVDFTNLGIHDEHINMLGGYLRRNPNLRSIVLDKNPFTDDGLTKLTQELKTNTKLAHLSIRGCQNITDEGLRQLCDVICTVNTVLFQIDLDPINFDKELARKCVTESALNRDIQEKLKPRKILSELNFKTLSSDKKAKSAEERGLELHRAQLIQQYESIQKAQNASNLNISIDSIGSGVVKENNSEEKKQFQLPNILEEVVFVENAPVGECFASVLKAWRIHNPNVIQVTSQNLTDDQLKQLCEFLKHRNMIKRLNLRKNKISNDGAIALADFIKNFDHTITHLDITRNRIGADGGQALLEALSTTTRIVEFEIKYGNPISSKMGRIFEREIKANLQTNQPTKNKRRGISRYELVDKGPDYMRCAIKMTELQNIVHLSLPNNMLGLEDARMLADMIYKNTPLKTLNLSQNELDADCAALIANSIIFNSNLTVLNVRDNRLGDLGVQLLTAPLIRKQLQIKEICCKQVPVFNNLNMKLVKNPATTTRSKNNLPIMIMSNLQMIDFTSNIITEEMFKNISTLLKLDPKIILETDDPKSIREAEQQLVLQQIMDERKKQQNQFAAKNKEKNKGNLKNKVGPGDITKKHLLPGDSALDQTQGDPQIDNDNKTSSEESEDEEVLEARKLAQEKKRIGAIRAHQRRKECKLKWNLCLQKFCCFKDDLNQFDSKKEIYPDTRSICCWRMLRARRLANQFYTSEQTIRFFEKSSSLQIIGWILTINYFALYTIAVIPFIMKAQVKGKSLPVNIPDTATSENRILDATNQGINLEEVNKIMNIVNIAFVGFTIICEFILLLAQKSKVNLKVNLYVLAQMVTGVTQRATILLSAQLTAAFLKEKSGLGYVLGFVVGITLIVSQCRAIQMFIAGIKYNNENMLPNTARCFRLSYAAGYFANALIYKKISIDPSRFAIQRSNDLAAEKLQLMSFTGLESEQDLQKKRMNSIKGTFCQWGNPKFWQLMMSDIPLIIAAPVAAVKKLVDFKLLIIVIVITIIDIINMYVYLTHVDQLSIDSDDVFKMVDERKKTNQQQMELLIATQTNDFDDPDLMITDESVKEIEQLNMSSVRLSKTHDDLGAVELNDGHHTNRNSARNKTNPRVKTGFEKQKSHTEPDEEKKKQKMEPIGVDENQGDDEEVGEDEEEFEPLDPRNFESPEKKKSASILNSLVKDKNNRNSLFLKKRNSDISSPDSRNSVQLNSDGRPKKAH